jgi:hypothetical protein
MKSKPVLKRTYRVLEETYLSILTLQRALPDIEESDRINLYEDVYSNYILILRALYDTSHRRLKPPTTKPKQSSQADLLFYLAWKLRIISKTLPPEFAERTITAETYTMKILTLLDKTELSTTLLFGIEYLPISNSRFKEENKLKDI